MAAAPRDLSVVIDVLCAAVPNAESPLIKHLQHIKDKLQFTAPEIMSLRWLDVRDVILNELALRPDAALDARLRVIYNGT